MGYLDSVTQAAEALKTLQAMGRGADADAALQQAEDDTITAYTSVALDTTHTADWKTQKTAQIYASILAQLASRLSAKAGTSTTSYKQDAEAVYGIGGLAGDQGSLMLAARDARQRVSDMTDSIKLQQQLASAVESGDDTMARAVCQQAIALRDADTTTAFQSAYPRLSGAVDRLWTIANRNPINTLDSVMGMRLAALKPQALRGLQDWEIDALAGQ